MSAARSGSCQVAHRGRIGESCLPSQPLSACLVAHWALGAILPALCPTALHQAARPRVTFTAQVAWIPAGQGERDCGEPSRTEPDESHPAECHKVGGSIPSLPTTSTLPWSTSPGRLGCCGPSPGGPRPCPRRRGVAGSRGRAAAPRPLPPAGERGHCRGAQLGGASGLARSGPAGLDAGRPPRGGQPLGAPAAQPAGKAQAIIPVERIRRAHKNAPLDCPF